MGIGPFKNSSCTCTQCQPRPLPKNLPNPDPKNYRIVKTIRENSYIAVLIIYPDCNNYEGKKIIVYDKGTTLSELINKDMLDPHFCENTKLSPIARFEPTTRGWEMAIKFMGAM